MSPGATFERVYHELKRMLAEGELPPGTPIEPALIGKQIASSITPIRDALHRLTGERLVEAPNHNGFRVPFLTEAALRDLYRWNGLVVEVAAKRSQPGFKAQALEHLADTAEVETSTAALFLEIAKGAGSVELAITVGILNDRLAPFRRVEHTTMTSVTDELTGLTQIAASGDRAALTAAVTRYHRRRIAAVARIIAQATHPVAG